MSESYANFQESLGYRFRSTALLRNALTHPSYRAENPEVPSDNQRLEFLGDAVLQLALTEALYGRYPEMAEGQLTRLRAALANEKALARFARGLDLGSVLLLGKGERSGGGRRRPSNLADALEAVFGAVYLESGLSPVRALTERLMKQVLYDPRSILTRENPKGQLQELTQESFGTTPDYTVVNTAGPEHAPQFTVRVTVSERELTEATAGSRKKAEKAAALRALRILSKENRDTST